MIDAFFLHGIEIWFVFVKMIKKQEKMEEFPFLF